MGSCRNRALRQETVVPIRSQFFLSKPFLVIGTVTTGVFATAQLVERYVDPWTFVCSSGTCLCGHGFATGGHHTIIVNQVPILRKLQPKSLIPSQAHQSFHVVHVETIL